MRCPRCAGLLVRDDDELKCSLCGRRFPLPPPPPPPGYIACACETPFKRVVNCTRCGPCQLADLARRARGKRARKGKSGVETVRSRRPVLQEREESSLPVRESKSKRERRARVGREEKPKPPRYCVDCQTVLGIRTRSPRCPTCRDIKGGTPWESHRTGPN